MNNKFTMYVPDYMESIRQRAIKEAKKNKQGLMYLLLSTWAIHNGIKPPRYQSPGEAGNAKRWGKK